MSAQKFVQADGDKVTWKIQVCNNSISKSIDNRLIFTLPTGVTLTGPVVAGSSAIVVSPGVFNSTNLTWFLGDLLKNYCITEIAFEFTVNDITQVDADNSFIVSAVLNGHCSDDKASDNTLKLMITVGTDCVKGDLFVGADPPDGVVAVC